MAELKARWDDGDTGTTRRAFLVKTLSAAAAFALPASIAEAGRRARRRTRKKARRRAHRGSRKQVPKSSARAKVWIPRKPDELARVLTPEYRSLSLYNMHTGERLAADYFAAGTYDTDVLKHLNWVLRDHRTDEVRAIDPGVLDLLYAIRAELQSDAEVHIISGYRSPFTNLMKFLTEPGVARHSYHIDGQAIDFFLPERSLDDVRRAAITLAGGGVGYYPRSGFVHVDTGPVRYW